MDRRTQARIRALVISCSLISAAACSDNGTITDAPILANDAAELSRQKAMAAAFGITSSDTSIATNASLRLFWNETTPTYAISGRNKVAITPVWTVRNSDILRLSSTSGMYANLTARSAGSTYVVGMLGNVKDSLKVTVTTVVAPPADAPKTPVDTTTVTTTSVPPANDPTTPVVPTGTSTGGSLSYNVPTLPAAIVSTTYPTISGTSRRVANGGDLQAALNAAQPGDEVVLANGATFTGNYTLPAKASSSSWIVVRAETVPVGAGTRITPSAAAGVAKVVTPNSTAAFTAGAGASKWRLVGIEIAHASGAAYNYGLVILGMGIETSLTQLPSDIILDRVYVHGSTTDGNSRCVSFNGKSLAVIDSWLSECHAKGGDAQGVGGWNGPGPFLIENNHIEASGQGIMFGGADPTIANLTPSDITIRRNYIYKPLSWANGKWSVKAALELKHARRVLFDGNVIENHWADAQVGYAIVFQAVSQDNTAPWTTVRDITVQNNIFKNCTSGINMFSRYNSVIVTPTSRVAVLNNLMVDVGRDPVSGALGRTFQLLSELEDITIANNTATMTSGNASAALMFDGLPTVRTVIANNVFSNTEYGILGSGIGTGTAALNYFAPGGVFKGNVVPNQSASTFPADNFFPSISSLLFKAAGSNYELPIASAFFTGVLGKVGIDNTVLSAATAGVVR